MSIFDLTDRHLHGVQRFAHRWIGPYSKLRQYHTQILAALFSLGNGAWYLLPAKTFQSTPAYRYFMGPEEIWALFCILPAIAILYGVVVDNWRRQKTGLLGHICFWAVISIIFFITNTASPGGLIALLIALVGADGYIETQLAEDQFLDSLAEVSTCKNKPRGEQTDGT